MNFFSLLRLCMLGAAVSSTVTFVAGSPSATTSSLALSPNTLVADGTTSSTVTVSLHDAYGNVVANGAIQLAASGGNTTFGATNGSSDANGQFQTTLVSTQAQTEVISATLAGSVTIRATVQFVPGPPVAANSNFSIAPITQVADNNSNIVATLTLRDSLQNPVSGVVPVFSASGGNTTISAPAATNALGQSSVNYTSTLAQAENVIVSAGSLTFSRAVTFIAGPPATATSTMSINPNTGLYANGSQASTIKVVLADQYGNLAGNQNVTWSASSGNNIFFPASALTNATGSVTTQMTSTTSGARTVTATAGGAKLSAAVNFLRAGNTTSSSFTANPNAISANGNSQSTITLMAKDANATALGNVAVNLIEPVGNRVITPRSGTTDSNGMFTATLSTTQAGYRNVVAQFAGTQMTAGIRGAALGNNCNQTLRWGGPPWPTVGTSSAYGAVVEDFNGDGNRDIAIADFGGHVNVMFGLGNKLFQPAVQYGTGGAVTGLAAGDLNNDGFTDFVTCNAGPNTVSVLLGSSNGAFQATSPSSFAVGTTPKGVVIGDLNNDGVADIATSNQNANTVSVLFGRGDGTFNAQSVFPAGNQPYGIAISPISNANMKDIVVSNAAVGTVSLLANAGGNMFSAPQTFAVGAGPRGIALGDVNGDGKTDIVCTNSSANSLSVLIGQGNTTFATQTTYAMTGSPRYVALKALNGGNVPDIVAVAGNNQAYVLGNTGNGNFVLQYTLPTGNFSQGLGIGDIDGDGLFDLLVPLGSPASAITVAYNRGNYSFGTSTNYAAGSPLFALSGDYDADGNVDLMVINYTSAAQVYWGTSNGTFSNTTSVPVGQQPLTASQADLNGDGTVDFVVANSYDGTVSVIVNQGNRTFAPQVTYPTNTSPSFVALADLDNNSTIDLAVVNKGSNNINFFSNAGNANFTAVSAVFSTLSAPLQMATSDFNADGYVDFVVSNSSSGSVTLAFNQGSFQFTSQANITVGSGPNSIAAGDINGDGFPDAVVANYGATSLSVLLNQNNTLNANNTLTVGSQPSSVLIQDINGDAIVDIVASLLNDNAIAVFLGSASGTFSSPLIYPAGGVRPYAAVFADFNQDGHQDFATANNSSQSINVSLWTACQ